MRGSKGLGTVPELLTVKRLGDCPRVSELLELLNGLGTVPELLGLGKR